jgi:hypothetical protein
MSGGELFPDFVFKARFRGNSNRLKKKKGYISCHIDLISFSVKRIRGFSTETNYVDVILSQINNFSSKINQWHYFCLD